MQSRIFRNESYSLLIAVVAGLFALASITTTVVRGSPVAPMVVVCAFTLFCWLRLARAGVYADGEGIKVLNPLSTKRVPWRDIQRFAVRPSKGFPALGFAELRDGTRVPMWGIQARSSSVVAKRVPEELVGKLNERLAQERERMEA